MSVLVAQLVERSLYFHMQYFNNILIILLKLNGGLLNIMAYILKKLIKFIWKSYNLP